MGRGVPRAGNAIAAGGRAMRRILVPGFVSMLPLLAASASSPASSIITLGMPGQTPSIITAGEPQATPVEPPATAITAEDTEILTIGDSVIAVGPDAIPPSQEEVASVTGTTEAEPDRPEWMAEDAALPLRLGD